MKRGYRILVSDMNVTKNDLEFIREHWTVDAIFDNLYDAKIYLSRAIKKSVDLNYSMQTFDERRLKMESYKQIMAILALYEELDRYILKYAGNDLKEGIIRKKAELFDETKKIILNVSRETMKGGE